MAERRRGMTELEHAENERRHNENKAAISEVSTMQAEANRKTDRLCLIIEGDGNGNPGLVRKFDKVGAILDAQEARYEEEKERKVRRKKFFWWVLFPALALWLMTWCSSAEMRRYVFQHFWTGDVKIMSILPRNSTDLSTIPPNP